MLLDIATSIPVILSVFIGHSVLFSIIFIVTYFSTSSQANNDTVKNKNSERKEPERIGSDKS